MSADVFQFNGYGLIQLENIILQIIKPNHDYTSGYEMYSEKGLSNPQLPSDSKIVFDQGMWDSDDENNTYENPGTVLYIPEILINVLHLDKDESWTQAFADIIKTVVEKSGFELQEDIDINKIVRENLTDIESEGCFY